MVSPDTAQQSIAGVRRLLRRPSDVKLPDDDVLKVINDLCKQYVQELSLGNRDRRTEVAAATITPLDTPEADFEVELPEVSDYEVQKLEYANSTGPSFTWREAVIVPVDAWARHFRQGYTVAAFYGSSSLATPCKVKLSLLEDEVARLQFRITYRLPLLQIVQMGDRPPIPSAHLPMLEYEAAILLAPTVLDSSAEWKEWIRDTLPLYATKLTELKKNWQEYLDSSVEPQVQPIPRSDRANRVRRPIRPYIPTQ